MEKKSIIFIIGVITITAFLSGCITGTEVEEDESDDVFKSDVVNLTNYTINFDRDRLGEILKATVNGRIENKLNRMINVKIIVEFYDNNDNYINNVTYNIYGLRVKPNPGYTTTFTLTYSDKNVENIDYVKIYVNEIKG